MCRTEGKSRTAGCGKCIPHQADAAGCGYLYKAIRNVKFSAPTVPFYSNVLGAVRTDFSDMPKALAEHIVSPVRFTDELAAMQAAGIDTFVEFGPKSVLTGLVKKTLKGVTAKNVENVDTLEGALA